MISGISPKILDDPNVCDEVKDALRVFSEEEMSTLFAAYREDDGTFIGMRSEHEGHAYKYADKDKAAAIEIIEEHYMVQSGIDPITRKGRVYDDAFVSDVVKKHANASLLRTIMLNFRSGRNA